MHIEGKQKQTGRLVNDHEANPSILSAIGQKPGLIILQAELHL
jgi:hypothetical protein